MDKYVASEAIVEHDVRDGGSGCCIVQSRARHADLIM